MYDLAARMQIMLVIYLRNSADPMGGSNYTGINSGGFKFEAQRLVIL